MKGDEMKQAEMASDRVRSLPALPAAERRRCRDAGMFAQFKKGQRKVAQAQVNDVAAKIVQFMADNSSECPKGIDDLVAQKYLPKRQKDPWNRDLIIRCPGTINTDGVDVVSLGPDGQEGTADDVKAAEQ